jgi:hypothetical protein
MFFCYNKRPTMLISSSKSTLRTNFWEKYVKSRFKNMTHFLNHFIILINYCILLLFTKSLRIGLMPNGVNTRYGQHTNQNNSIK